MTIRDIKLRSGKGFTLVELTVVLCIIAITAGVGLVLVIQGSADTSRRAAKEIVKEDLRRVYSLANATIRSGPNDYDRERDEYLIVFHDSDASEFPNAYKVIKRTYEGEGAWEEADVAPDPREVNNLVPGTNWIRPSTDQNICIGLPQSGEYVMKFVSRGSIMTVEPPGEKWVFIKKNPSETIPEDSADRELHNGNIEVSDYGDVSG